ncbi:MAG: hypothetical protein LH616_02500 [Ilumatobacteraceae bacterium]|nr:hypothetical protein [Ilumatobacteraceae bacterium]
MLFSASAWPGLADGSITVTFRTWSTPQAKVGGRYRVGGMLLEATAVAEVSVSVLTDDDAAAAGEGNLTTLMKRLHQPALDSVVWRVDLRYVGVDDRIERRVIDELTDDDVAGLRSRLDRLDRAGEKPWTRTTLQLIEKYPGVVSTALARHTGQERPDFKINVRKLKEMGLTESLQVGYQLSPRGVALLRAIR